ncbi:MAG TPA: glycosyltransferase family 9 protein [Dongiaceae bacterium]|nr:glycosyltransferase family 9 protein [Dongiaceae bacterium]
MLKIIDRLAGVLIASCLPSAPVRPFQSPRRILIIRPGGIGDAVLLAPSINAINTSYPDSRITILAERRNCGVFALMPRVSRVLCYDRPGELIRAALGLYDAVIDTEQWHRLSAVIARLVRAPMKIGFDTNERRRMFTHRIGYDLSAYEPDNFALLLKPLGVDCQRKAETASLSLPPQAMSKARHLLHPLGSGSFVVIFPGASIPEKRWGGGRFTLVAKRLAEAGYKIVVVGGKEERGDGDMIAGEAGLNLAGMTTLAETAAVIARSSLVISGDSGVLHIAAGLDIPTVSLFGPSSETKWAPRGERHVALNHHLSCSPCTKFGTMPPCPIKSRCIRDISPDEVMAATLLLLSLPAEKK